MVSSGASRERLAGTLNAAYGDGLLSEGTLVHRLEQLLGSRLIDPQRLIGDLTVRAPRRTLTTAIAGAIRSAQRLVGDAGAAQVPSDVLLALDWTGSQEELLVGRHPECDVVLTDPTVSRRHARLRFRDGNWVVQDLDSTNGTTVNTRRVVRCRLMPGDRLLLGSESLLVD